jgi:hypothetical protein
MTQSHLAGLFMAKLTGPDGFVEENFFSTDKAAREWLTGAGLRGFEGKVARSELYAPDDRLIWSKLRPKDVLAPRRTAKSAGLGRIGRPAPRLKGGS